MQVFDNIEEVKKIDESGMVFCVEDAPKHLLEAGKIDFNLVLKKDFDKIVVAGMGGSGIGGEVVLDAFFNDIKKPVFLSKGYLLPEFLDDKTLFLAVSYSGDTEETLSALKEAEKRGMQIISLSSGGKLKEIAEQNKYPLIELPRGFQPRASFYYIVVSLVKILEKLGVISSKKEDILESVKILEKIKNDIGISKPERVNSAKQLAVKIKDKIPLIFASSSITGACALRMKNQFNENSKLPAFVSLFPELNHNEIVPFDMLKKGAHQFVLILLRDKEEHHRIVKRIEITKSLLGGKLSGVNEIFSSGESRFAKIISLIFFGDILSCYVALLRGIDPTPVDIIGKLKKELRR